MPPLPAAPHCASLDTHFTIGDDTHALSRIYLQFPNDPGTPDLQSLANAAGATFGTAGLQNEMAGTVTVTSFVATSLVNPTLPQGINGVSLAGTEVRGGNLPAETCAVIAYSVARRYRGGHPRGYWPFGQAPDMQSPQLWSTTFRDALQTAFRTWINDICGTTYVAGAPIHVNVSYYSGSTWHQKPNGNWIRIATRRGAPLIEPVVSQNVRLRIGSQRRRMR